jgi:SAM-dependent methyltransferase
MPVTEDEVRACYRYILGREPENEEVVARHARTAESVAGLRRRFLASGEFRNKYQGEVPASPRLPLDTPPIEVETRVSEADLARLLDHTAAYWSGIGEVAPHWSVLTQEAYRPENIAASRDAFYATGALDLKLVQAVLERAGAAPARLETCLEYGCGVGRATAQLARTFPRVIGCDVSPGHLRLARERMEELGLANVELVQIRRELLHPEQGVDLWYSRLVLQHNPPPMQLRIIELALRSLRPGGYAIFQVPTHVLGYSFRLAPYLAGELGKRMEMHAIPQREVFAAAAAAGCHPVEVRDDTHLVSSDPARWLSNMFVFHRPG